MLPLQPSTKALIIRSLKLIFAGILLITLMLLPVKMGEKNVNQDLFLIGTLEQMAEQHYGTMLTQIASAWAITKLSSKAIAIAQRAELVVTPVGVGVTLAPGEILAVIGDNLDRISSYLFTLTLLVGVQQCLVGYMSYLCLKIILPLALILYMLSCLIQTPYPWLKHTSALLVKYTLALWLFLPLSAMLSDHIQQGYMGNAIEHNLTQINAHKDSIQELEAETSLWEKTKNIASAIKLQGFLENLEQLVTQLMSIVSLFLINNVVLPLISLGVLAFLLQQFNAAYRATLYVALNRHQ